MTTKKKLIEQKVTYLKQDKRVEEIKGVTSTNHRLMRQKVKKALQFGAFFGRHAMIILTSHRNS